jgi:hypothetical protein
MMVMIAREKGIYPLIEILECKRRGLNCFTISARMIASKYLFLKKNKIALIFQL